MNTPYEPQDDELGRVPYRKRKGRKRLPKGFKDRGPLFVVYDHGCTGIFRTLGLQQALVTADLEEAIAFVERQEQRWKWLRRQPEYTIYGWQKIDDPG